MGWRSNFKRRFAARGKSVSSASVAYASTQRSGRPTFINHTADSVRIRHTELLGSITGSNGFTIDDALGLFRLNPGLSNTFPWLATQAGSWEKYKFHDLKFIYHTKCSTAVPGSMMLAVDYDALDGKPSSEQTMSNLYGAVESAPWKELTFQCNMKRMSDSRFVRTGPIGAISEDLKTYDQGTLFVGTCDGTAVPWGKLWASYDVELQIPQQAPPNQIGVYYSAVSSTAALFPIIADPVINAKKYNIYINGTSTANQIIVQGMIPGKYYMLDAQFVGTVASALDFTSTETVRKRSAVTGAATTALANVEWLATSPAAYFNCTLTATTVTKSSICIMELLSFNLPS